MRFNVAVTVKTGHTKTHSWPDANDIQIAAISVLVFKALSGETNVLPLLYPSAIYKGSEIVAVHFPESQRAEEEIQKVMNAKNEGESSMSDGDNAK